MLITLLERRFLLSTTKTRFCGSFQPKGAHKFRLVYIFSDKSDAKETLVESDAQQKFDKEVLTADSEKSPGFQNAFDSRALAKYRLSIKSFVGP